MGLFHITTREAWTAVEHDSEYRPASLDSEGFIHLSEDRQLLPSADRHFTGQTNLVVLSLRRDKVRAELRYDDAHGESFPHLYGPLNLDAVVEVVDLPIGEDGRFLVPEEWQPWASMFGRGVSDEMEIDRARVPDGGELVLYKMGEHFEIRVDGRELMATRSSESERQLARVGCDGLAARSSARVLIGGLGMGFTVRAALDLLADDAAVTVVEVAQAVVDWNRGPLADVAKRPLEDPRVTVTVADVGTVLRETKVRYDAILLDVDNGPEGLTRKANHALYTAPGIATAKMALRPNGRYAVWSASRNKGFEQRVQRAGLDLQTHGTGHVVYCGVAPQSSFGGLS